MTCSWFVGVVKLIRDAMRKTIGSELVVFSRVEAAIQVGHASIHTHIFENLGRGDTARLLIIDRGIEKQTHITLVVAAGSNCKVSHFLNPTITDAGIECLHAKINLRSSYEGCCVDCFRDSVVQDQGQRLSDELVFGGTRTATIGTPAVSFVIDADSVLLVEILNKERRADFGVRLVADSFVEK